MTDPHSPAAPAAKLSAGRVAVRDCDAVWLGDAAAVPPMPPRTRVMALSALENPEPVICLAPLDADHPAASVRDALARAGELAFVIILLPDAMIDPASAARVVALGADDAVPAGDMPLLTLALARGSQALRRQGRHLVEARIHEREAAYLQACLDNLPTPIFFKNRRGIYTACNAAFANMLGLTTSDIIGNSVHEISTPERAQRYDEADRDLMEKGGVQIYESRVIRADGAEIDISFHKARIVGSDGEVRGLAGAMLDITARKRLEAQLADQAARDPLTGIFNRRQFFLRAQELICGATGPVATVAVLDLDSFKAINDRYGHAAGDTALCEVARLLERHLGGPNLVARAGGEEFFALVPNCALDDAEPLFELLRQAIAGLSIPVGDTQLGVTVSIGLAEHRIEAGPSVWDSLRLADAALYRAKGEGRNRIAIAA